MLQKKKIHLKEKLRLHKRNKHRERYDLRELISVWPGLAEFVKLNAYQDESIDFFDPKAVKMLNTALLIRNYDLKYWDIPDNYLCPAVPGRADYLHYLADLMSDCKTQDQGKEIPTGAKIKCLDIGVGANCIYPVIGHKEYGWSFVGSDIDPVAIDSANNIIEKNPHLKESIELRLQTIPGNIFHGIIHKGDYFDLTICNPPFHMSAAEAQAGTIRKLRNLKHNKTGKETLNFGGQSNELWCKGGEARFIADMIFESKQFANSCFWFTTLVSNQAHLENVYLALKKENATDVRTIKMGQGNKISRIVAWTFLSPDKQKTWINKKWINTN